MIPEFKAYLIKQKKIVDIREINYNLLEIGWRDDDFHDRVTSFDDIKFMRTTGFKDINGVEIFEGHVVKFKNPYDKRFVAIGVVVWREDKACFGIDMEGTTEQFELYRITAENYLTVTGNIYEDEHLLEEE